MTIISYNVNGIRAAMRKGLTLWLKNTEADIVCFQEIKALESQIETEAFEALGYKYQYWFPAEKKGYSGVGII
jgi:exodeoxyribonuclease-3